MGNLRINLLGTSFEIKSGEDSDYLEKVYGYYRRIIDQLDNKTGGQQTPLQIAILAGITLVDELYKEKGRNVKFQSALERNSTDEEADRITKALIEKIDQVLK